MAEVIQGDFPVGAEIAPRTPAVAALSLSPVPGDLRANLLLAGEAIRVARTWEPALRWVVLPELFTCAYSSLESVHRHAEDAERGPSARFFASLARELGVFVAYGFPERGPGPDTVFDSANLVGPGGTVATYRKRNLVETTVEHRVFAPGTGVPVVEVGGLRVALAVCWDLGFPEVAREAAALGADLVLTPAAWRHPWGAQYDLSCAARALDSGVFLASANQIGDYPEARFDAPGHVYGPDGLRVSPAADATPGATPGATAGAASIGLLDPTAPTRWRTTYGDTLSARVPIIGTEPIRTEPAEEPVA